MPINKTPNREATPPAARGRRRRKSIADHPSVGIWVDREDMKDVHAWLKKIRTARYLRGDMPRKNV